ncbi:hypothetical protein Tco_1351837 [Tanacetum coccineum]
MALPNCLMPMDLISKSTATVSSITMEGNTPPLVIQDIKTFTLWSTNSWDRVELASRFSLGNFRGLDMSNIARITVKNGNTRTDEWIKEAKEIKA